MAKWWERALNTGEDLLTTGTFGGYETVKDLATGKGFTAPTHNFFRSGADLVGQGEEYRNIGEDVGDFIADPTGRKSAANDMASILRDQMTQGGEQWGKYLDEFGGQAAMGREKTTHYLGHDYGEMLPDAQRYESGLDMQDYYGPEAERYQSGMRSQDYYHPEAQRHQFDPFSVEEDPAYQFARDQGLGQIERRAAAGSGSLGPATSKAMADYVTGLAGQHGQQAFDRWQTQQGMEYGAGRDYRGDVERGIGQRYGVDTGQEMRNYGYGRDFYGDQVNQGMRRAGLDIGAEGRDYGYGRDYYGDQTGNVLNQYNMDAGQAGMGMNLQGMRNPLGYTGQQAGLAGQVANARGQQGGPAVWDWLNLGTNIAGSIAPFM